MSNNKKRISDIIVEYEIDLMVVLQAAKALGMKRIVTNKSTVYDSQIQKILNHIHNSDSTSNLLTVNVIVAKYPIPILEVIEVAKKLNLNEITKLQSYISRKQLLKILNYHKSHYPHNKKEIDSKSNATKVSNNTKVRDNSIQNEKLSKVKSSTNLNKTPLKQEVSEFEFMMKNSYLIFFDTSSLMNPNISKILENKVIPLLKKYKKELYIVDSVHKELEKNCKSAETSIRKRAEYALDMLATLSADKLYKVAKTNSVHTHFADGELLSYFTDIRVRTNLCLVTNDNSIKKGGNLSGDILNLKNNKSVETKFDVKVFYISSHKENPQLTKFEKNKDSNFRLHEHPPEIVTLF